MILYDENRQPYAAKVTDAVQDLENIFRLFSLPNQAPTISARRDFIMKSWALGGVLLPGEPKKVVPFGKWILRQPNGALVEKSQAEIDSMDA